MLIDLEEEIQKFCNFEDMARAPRAEKVVNLFMFGNFRLKAGPTGYPAQYSESLSQMMCPGKK